MKLILLGAPGAGKGTQADILCEKQHIPVIGTGNMIREAVKNGSEMGIKAKSYMESGALVPDDVVIGIIKERLVKDDCKDGFILDGFPRTLPQAQALDGMGVVIDRVIELSVSDEEILDRLGGRRVCTDCGTPYHVATKPPKTEGKCDKCGGELIIRKDDNPATIKDRLKVYHEQTEPLKAYYEKQGKLAVVRGQKKVEDTTKLVLAILEG